MRRFAALAFAVLAACGGGGSTDNGPPSEIPEGLPVIVGGFVNWWDVQTTPDSTLGIVNGTGNAIVSVTVHGTDDVETFATFIAPGSVWASGADFLPGVYLVSADGADGRVFQRYFHYKPDIGWEAAVISAANWNIDL
jgi:hypothetical protein